MRFGGCVGDRVLDLCCCPGAKLLMINDLLGEHGTLHGEAMMMLLCYDELL